MDPQHQIDTTVPHSARIWNFFLGGTDNYPVDRAAGEQVLTAFPGMVDMARQSRRMLTRVVRYLTGIAGMRQFLDIGTGLPTMDNTHEVAQRLAPGSRVVYVDNDPMVGAHARALLTSTPEGATDFLEADVRDPGAILARAGRTLDLDRPVALMLMGILGLIGDDDQARAVVARLLEALPPGSHLALYDGTDTDPAYTAAISAHNARPGVVPYTPRGQERIAAFFAGTDLVEPGVVPVTRWRPDPGPEEAVPEVACAGGVGRKP
ncbi:SAM-dependent methyltransferase [Actinomadura graeca]|uniref:SAM-dependent methyltransferase n=1 Tax=Actinomadura graeca TaxID=2750812 RepID=A0ABX8R3G2_9ACTN|nr:SAM-dependent methyltransferase [Actinomadura graeca]QXJ25626.1 SAM-dependent methyltransferase [Actinomadura graeca]